jgi:hypothetical protein
MHVRKIAGSDYQLRLVHLAVRMEQLGYHLIGFVELSYLRFFPENLSRKLVSSKCDKNNGYFTRILCHINDNISLNSS